MSSTTNISVEKQAWNLAAAGDLNGLISLYPSAGHKQHFVDMAVMGAVDHKQKETGEWALLNGACYLWTIQQPRDNTVYVSEYKYTRNLSMLGGPGEVVKGTFKGLSLNN